MAGVSQRSDPMGLVAVRISLHRAAHLLPPRGFMGRLAQAWLTATITGQAGDGGLEGETPPPPRGAAP